MRERGVRDTEEEEASLNHNEEPIEEKGGE